MKLGVWKAVWLFWYATQPLSLPSFILQSDGNWGVWEAGNEATSPVLPSLFSHKRLGGARVCAEFFMLGSLKFTGYEYYWIFIVQRAFCQSSWPIHFKLHVKIFKKQDCRKFTPNKSTAYVPIQVSLMWTIVIVIAHTMAGMKINIISRSRMETRQVRIKCWI